jgi:hypothetical protein
LKIFISEEVEKKHAKLVDTKYAKIEEEERIDVTAEYPSKNL